MALSTLFIPLFALVLSTACQDPKPPQQDSAAAARADTGVQIQHVLTADQRESVLRARALDRADSLEAARAAYEDAAKKIPIISEWLYLRAAGVTADSAARAAYYVKLREDAARDRIRWTEAIARERTRDFAGAIRVYASLGARLDALRLRVSPPSEPAAVAAARSDLLTFIAKSGTSAETREAIGLFDKVFAQATPAEELAIAQAAARSGLPDRAATAYSRAFSAGLGNASDRMSYGSVLFRLRKYSDAATQFTRITAPPQLAAGAQYQRARALVAMGNTAAARTVLRSITNTYARDTSAASAFLLLADLATDENRDGDAREALVALLKRFPTGGHATNARFRAGMISYIRGDNAEPPHSSTPW